MKTSIFILLAIMLLKNPLTGQTPILVNNGNGGIIVWNSPPIGYANGIHLTNNVDLTLDGNTWAFNEFAKIEVDPGCKLTVTNSTVLTDNNTNNKWIGIEANGDYTKNQYAQNGKPNNNIKNGSPGASDAWEGILELTQTRVILTGCSILNAACGVKANLGAIIRARGTIFLDNQIGIHVNKYVSPIHPELNASYMMDCNFIWNNLNNNFNNLDLRGIYLQVVKGVNIGGCEFTNNFSSRSDYEERSIGIYCEYSSMHASKSGNLWCNDDNGCPDNCYQSTSYNNLFNKLYCGILITSTRYIPVAIRNSNFTNCNRGIEMVNGWGCVITKCSFTATAFVMNANFTNWLTYNKELMHINSENCIDFTIYDNDFQYNYSNVWSINIDDAGFDRSRVQKNRFQNSLVNATWEQNICGLRVNGNCIGLEADCNSFTNQGADIYISAGANCYNRKGLFDAILSPDGKGLLNNFSNPHTNLRYGVLIAHDPDPSYDSFFVKYLYHTSANSNQIPRFIYGQPVDQYSEGFRCFVRPDKGKCDLTCSQLSSVEKYQTTKLMKIYPNPNTDGKFQIEFSNPQYIRNCIIYNSIGQKIQEYKIFANSKIYNLEIPSKGIYFVSIIDKFNNISSEKVICQ